MTSGGYSSIGSEFLVNTTTTGLQTDVAITSLASGGFVMTWTDNSATGADTSGSGIKAQIYDANGNKQGGEFLVNTQTLNAQEASSVTSLANGGFVVTWTDNSATGPDADRSGIKAQIFDANGNKVGAEFLVNTTIKLSQTSPVITTLANGGFVVSWIDASGTGPDPKGTGVKAQIYSATGQKVGTEIQVNTTILNSQNFSSITGLANGGFVATWVDSSGQGGDPTAPSVKGQIFSATGAKVGSEFLVNTNVAGSQDQTVVTSLSNGGFVVVWRDTSGVGDTSGSGIKAQLYDASGARVGTEFQVNTTELNTQDQPTVTSIPGGGFAVSWEDNSILASDSSGFGIKTQVFDNQGSKVGGEFQTNSVTAGNQTMPAITALSSGALVVAWADASGLAPDPSGGIKAQIFNPTSGAISDLVISNTQLSEAAVENTIIASLTANGALNASYSYQLIDDSTGGAFKIVDNKLEVKNSLLLDYETQPNATLTIRATDTFGNSFDKVFNMTLQDAVIENRYAAGDEVLANTTIANNQQLSSMTAISGNRYVIAWTDSSGIGDTSSNGVKAQIVDANGNKVGSEFQVNTQTLNSQDNPAVASLGSGGFVITWTDASATGGDTSSTGIKGQLYDASGAAVGSEFLVNTTTLNAQKNTAVSGLSNGGFVVTWNDASLLGGDNSVSSIKAQIFDAAGTAVGGEFLVNTNINNRQDTPTVTGLSGGGFVASWDDSSGVGDTSKDGIKAQIFDATGNKIGGEFLVNTQTNSNQQQETITALDTGGFVVAWADASNLGGDSDNFGIKMQIYDASGNKVGGETLVNTTTSGPQIAPTVTALSTGGFVVGWADYSGAGPETGTSGIKAQIFADDGTRVGGEFIVNNEVRGTQGDPTIAATASGGFALGWTDFSGQVDDSGASIKMRTFTPLATQGPPPSLIAGSDTLTGTEDTVSTFQAATLLANDVDAQGLPLSLTDVTAVSGGTVSLDAQGNITFTPFANFNGAALFNYTVADTSGLTATGRVTVNVAAVNDPPTANNDQVTVSEDGATIPGSTLLANDVDVDVGDKLSILSIPATSSGGAALTLTNGIITYAPGQTFQYLHTGETATDSFSYTMTDSGGLTSTATVNLIVAGANDAPSNAVLSNARVDENAANGTVVGTLSATDPDHDEVLTYSLTNNAGGRFAVNSSTGVVTVANGALLDYETSPTQTIVTRVTDSTGLFIDTSFTIALNNLPEPKTYTGDNGANAFTASTNDLWTINGLGGNDTLTGNASSDTINGGTGNDIIDGAGGADTMYGGTGNDTFYVDNPGDQVIENSGEGTDLVYTSIDYTTPVNVENITQTGTADISATGNDAANTITGNSGANTIHGGNGGDFLLGNDGNDTLYGEAANDSIQGGNGDDTLIGGAGNDQLTGGAGADRFVFDSLGTVGEFDTVKDFAPAEGDVFVFSKAVFTAFANTPLGTLPTSAFVNGTAATTADQHIIYTKSSGNIYYDPDGNGSQAMVQIAFLSTKPASLSASNFQIG